MSICITRMNENVRATLKRDYLECKQKCLTGYLSKNTTLFQNELPLLKGCCCCRHLTKGTKHGEWLKSSSGPNEAVKSIKNQSKKSSLVSYFDGEKYPYQTGVQRTRCSSPRKGHRLKTYPIRNINTGLSNKAEHFNSDFKMHGVKLRKKNKLISKLEVNSNILENRVPTVLLSTSMSTENHQDNVNTETHFTESLLPPLEKLKSKFAHRQHSTIHDNYVNSGPQNLVCCHEKISGNNSSKNEKFHSTRQLSAPSNNVNCDNVTLRDLVHFNVVRFS